MRKLVLFIATGGGSGYAPIAPGTAGSAVGLVLWVLCIQTPGLSAGAYLAILAGLSVVAIWAAGEAEKIFQKRDDGRITVDEIAGQLLALAFLPAGWQMALAAFLLFRLFDIWKPWPARLAEQLPGGLGVVADDLIAGLYANLAGQLLWRVLLPRMGARVMAVRRQQVAWVLTIGDELLRGEIVDSNKSYLSERLLRLDLETSRHVTVGDDPAEIRAQLRAGASSARVILVSGGLGPTRDDITTEVVAESFGRRLVRNPEALENIRQFFESLGREMAENNAKQADFPEGAEVLANPLGTAPGFMVDVDGCLVFCMPGVPRELYRMMDQEVLPRLEARLASDQVLQAALLRTFGLGESSLDRDLSDLGRDDPDVSLGFRTQFPDNLVRVVARGADLSGAEARLREVVEEIRQRLGALVIAESEERLESVVGRLLREGGHTIATAESCTGGLIASLLTDVPGSSGYVLEGVVAYSNAAKIRQLGVLPADLEAHGAVSEPVARQMAQGIRSRTGADFGVATTGIAGPDGGTDQKPVGTLHVALATAAGVEAQCYQLMRDRGRNKLLAAHIALDWVRRRILGLGLPDRTYPRLRGVDEPKS